MSASTPSYYYDRCLCAGHYADVLDRLLCERHRFRDFHPDEVSHGLHLSASMLNFTGRGWFAPGSFCVCSTGVESLWKQRTDDASTAPLKS